MRQLIYSTEIIFLFIGLCPFYEQTLQTQFAMARRYDDDSSFDESASFLPQSPRSKRSAFEVALKWMRFLVNILYLILLIAILALLVQYKLETDFGGDVNHFVPRCQSRSCILGIL